MHEAVAAGVDEPLEPDGVGWVWPVPWSNSELRPASTVIMFTNGFQFDMPPACVTQLVVPVPPAQTSSSNSMSRAA